MLVLWVPRHLLSPSVFPPHTPLPIAHLLQVIFMYTAANALMAIIPGCLARVEAIQSKDELIETKVVRECSSAGVQ